MKKFKESTLDYKCITGCGVRIFNAVHDFNLKCPECGGRLKKMSSKKIDKKEK
jgi:DNA-directed RNA polymerase subunit RPC12/RpoP